MNNLFARVLLTLVLFSTVFGFTIRTDAQVGTNNLFCPHVTYTEGMLNLRITPSATVTPNFSAGMIGTLERINGKISGGIDWMPLGGSASSVLTSAPTNEIGSQLITWWSLANNRSTRIQITNASDNTGPHTSGGTLNVHIEIFGEDCAMLRDFCDSFTANDTHVYDLGDLETNAGTHFDTSALAGHEGIFIVTAVENCSAHGPSPGKAIDHNFLSGNVYISDSLDYTYGTNMYARQAICIPPRCTGILTGSEGATLDFVLPGETYGLFSRVSSAAGSDVVVMNIQDDYGPPYQARPASSRYNVSIFDNNEIVQSCGDITACFLRLGIDSALPARQDLRPPITRP